MPRGPKGEKHPTDPIGAAVMVGKIATGEIEEANKRGFPCFVRFPCLHAAATTPAQRLNVSLRSFHPVDTNEACP
jgi:hypothetical protein